VAFRNGDVTLSGTLLLPRREGPHPAIILVHGDGPETRDGYRQLARRFAERGIAALIYDKRGCGESGGRWPARFSELGNDAVAGIRFLRGRADIDGTKIGLWGGSQGGWIAPLAATMPSAEVRFVVVKAGPAVGPAQLARWKSVGRVVRAGHGADAVARVNRLMDLQFAILRSGQGWPQLDAEIGRARGEKWLPLVAVMRHSGWRSSWMTYGPDIDFDAPGTLARVDPPMLWLLGERDPETPLQMTVAELERLRKAGKDVTIQVFAGADHQIELPRKRANRPNYAPGYVETMLEWVSRQCE
jgi:uncharacterized protein